MKTYRGSPMTLGKAAEAQVRIIVWCKLCNYQVEPDPADMAACCGSDTPVFDWHKRLVCGQCGSRDIDFVLTGARR